MDIEFFLKERTKFTRYFHENASKPFVDIMEAIEKGDSPYDNPPYSEDGELAFLTEWLEANDAYNSVGLASLSMLSSAVQLYLSCWADRVERSDIPLKRKNKKGWLHAYKKITEDFGVDYSNCPVKFEIIEQIVLARNRTQHEEDITSNHVNHSKKDLSQHPSPHFVSDIDRKGLLKDDNSWWCRFSTTNPLNISRTSTW